MEAEGVVRKNAIFLDDNQALLDIWKLAALQADVSLSTYSKGSDFLRDLHKYSSDIEIYIDSNLGEAMQGEDFARQAYNQGYENIYLSTGYSSSDFPMFPWIKKVVGKSPPW